eukprot:5392855-Heterocapsa_arctica.AAC.1
MPNMSERFLQRFQRIPWSRNNDFERTRQRCPTERVLGTAQPHRFGVIENGSSLCFHPVPTGTRTEIAQSTGVEDADNKKKQLREALKTHQEKAQQLLTQYESEIGDIGTILTKLKELEKEEKMIQAIALDLTEDEDLARHIAWAELEHYKCNPRTI